MNKYIYIFLALILSSCVDEIDLDIHRNTKVVVNCLLNNSDTQKLSLTYSSSYGSLAHKEVEEATVSLYENSEFVGNFQKVAYTEWELNFRPQFGAEYKLVVVVDGYDTIEATTTMPIVSNIEALESSNSTHQKYFSILHYEPMWVFALNYNKHEDIVIDPSVVSPDFYLLDELSTDNPYADEFNLVDKPYASPAPDALSYNTYIRIKQKEEVRFYLVSKAFDYSLIVFRFASDEYDKYMYTSISKMLAYTNFEDPTQWLDESEVYTNINNGLGIFGAYAEYLFYYPPQPFFP